MADVAAPKAKRGNPKADQKDFGGPAKPLTPYFLFCGDIRAELTAELKEKSKDNKVPFPVFSAEATKRWKDVSTEQMEKYKAKHAEDKKTYETAFEEWKKTDRHKEYLEAQRKHSIKATALTAKKSLKEAGCPKKAPTMYFLFMQENAEKILAHAKKEFPDIESKPFREQFSIKGKKGNELYKALTPEELTALKEKCTVLKEKYNEEFAKFKETDAYKEISKKQDADREKAKNMQKEIKNHGKPVKEKKVKAMKGKKSKKAEGEEAASGEAEEEDEEEEAEEEGEEEEEQVGEKRTVPAAEEPAAKKAKSAEPVAPAAAETA